MTPENTLRLRRMRHNQSREAHRAHLRLHPEASQYTRLMKFGELLENGTYKKRIPWYVKLWRRLQKAFI